MSAELLRAAVSLLKEMADDELEDKTTPGSWLGRVQQFIKDADAHLSAAQEGGTPEVDALLIEIHDGRVYQHHGPMVELARSLERRLKVRG